MGWAVSRAALTALLAAAIAAQSDASRTWQTGAPRGLLVEQDAAAGTLTVRRGDSRQAIVIQNAAPGRRPYLHPLTASDGRVLTEDRPAHHPHQTGLFWGLTRVNGRDFFHNPGKDHWRRESVSVLQRSGPEVSWRVVYDLLDESGVAMLTESQRWTAREQDGRLVLDLEWRGTARTAVTIGEYDYGGLFLRMPWRDGMRAEVVNAARQRNEKAEGQRAMWIDVAMQLAGGNDLAHVAIFDHPDNVGYPTAWRVDGQFGVGAARSRGADWTIAAGASETIKHRFVIYTGATDENALTRAWEAFSGASTSALWTLAYREGRDATMLSPDEALSRMTTADGYRANLWAAEPMIGQPIAFCWDDRGRLWVAENHDYESRTRGFSGSGQSRILILEDTDGDGDADLRKVFFEGLAFPSAIAVGFGGVFVGAPPHLLFIPDANGDDAADEDRIEIRLTGWGIQDRHEVLNSLHWGPDGWLYGLQGFATSSKVRKPDPGGRLYRGGDEFPDVMAGEGVEINGGVWRYHPTADRFEVVAHGFSNPWGIDYDAKGRLFITACVIPHLFHVVPGGIYHRQGGRHFNPFVYGDISTIVDHPHRSAHGGARIYQSDAFPSSQTGRVFMANIHERAILSDVLVRKGSSFTARHGEDFVMANDPQWIGFSLEVGPDGALYALDWHDGDICGRDVLHRHTGRIFRIAPVTSLAENWDGRYGDLRRLSDADLVSLQTRRSDWHARRARVILQERAFRGTLAADTVARLRTLFETDSNPDWRLRAMWALHVTGGWNGDALIGALGDRDEHIRAWAVQLIAEDSRPPSKAIEAFLQLARKDTSAAVRLNLASALQRMDHDTRWDIAAALVGRAEDASDHNLPKMIWFGLEPLVPAQQTRALQLAAASEMPSVARSIARRMVDAEAIEPLVAAIGAFPKTVVHLLEGLNDGLEGRYEVVPPANWQAVLGRLKAAGPVVSKLALDVSQRFGNAEATRRALATVRSAAASVDDRRHALQTLALQRRPQLAAELPRLLAVSALRLDAIRAVGAYGDAKLAALVLERYPTFTPDEKTEALQALSSRGNHGRLLVEALRTGVVAREEIPQHVVRQLRRVVGEGFTEVWGAVETSDAEERVFSRYRRLLTDAALAGADLSKGRGVYLKTCGACHKLHGEGGALGPDLTGSNRASLEYLLANVLTPNADVADAYKMAVVTTRDGQTLTGNIVGDTGRRITLRLIGNETLVIDKSQIQRLEMTATSMMPPGLLESLSDREAIDLVAYLRTIARPK